jgi:hypothetical protein
LALTGDALLAIWHDIEQASRDEYMEWHTREHMPERLSIPGFTVGKRLINHDLDRYRYGTIYGGKDLEVFRSPAYLERLNNPTDWSLRVQPAFRNFLRVACVRLASRGLGEGGAVATVRLDFVDGSGVSKLRAGADALAESLLAMKGVCCVHVALARAEVSGARTRETELRPEMSDGVPVAGTMAHSLIQSFDDELDAFRAFARLYPQTVLLVDTYDTLGGVAKVIHLARELGADFRVRGVRLDSGDLADLAFRARQLLDDAGLHQVEIFASGSLDEDAIAELLAKGAPITGFGVGTKMGVSSDAPDLDIAYKLCAYAGRGRLKLSTGKPVLPGRKQVFRVEEDGRAIRDIIARPDEEPEGRPLLRPMMRAGRRLAAASVDLEAARRHAAAEIGRLPKRVSALEPADPLYPVEVSAALRSYQNEIVREMAA